MQAVIFQTNLLYPITIHMDGLPRTSILHLVAVVIKCTLGHLLLSAWNICDLHWIRKGVIFEGFTLSNNCRLSANQRQQCQLIFLSPLSFYLSSFAGVLLNETRGSPQHNKEENCFILTTYTVVVQSIARGSWIPILHNSH